MVYIISYYQLYGSHLSRYLYSTLYIHNIIPYTVYNMCKYRYAYWFVTGVFIFSFLFFFVFIHYSLLIRVVKISVQLSTRIIKIFIIPSDYLVNNNCYYINVARVRFFASCIL